MTGIQVRVLDDVSSVAREAAAAFIALATSARAAGQSVFSAALAAGPVLCLGWAALAEPEAAAQVEWDGVRIVPAEERHGPYTHPESSFRRLYLALGSKVPLRPGAFVRLWGEGEDPEVIAGYGAVQLRHLLGCDASAVPRFDLLALELGADGRLSGLLPRSPGLAERERLIVFGREPATGDTRFSVGPAIVAAAGTVIVVASGAEAAAGLPHAVNATAHGDAVSLRALRPSGGATMVLADRTAAAGL